MNARPDFIILVDLKGIDHPAALGEGNGPVPTIGDEIRMLDADSLPLTLIVYRRVFDTTSAPVWHIHVRRSA